ncbi:hypothetical protein I302_106224 [Kwoniella bestiolae CBS 10118]|uniref:Uncharacterized protein n=1 Tax=Kwoniella bestiolae CBS 10118 TaxID=1296100 RepID=A0A1B9G3G8_9TREE|nr:hypothetical protein I302_05348 [Kwoniella bestiolae CBS 10118]OCF25528.1 hypothetical protein I302_05348 [Kwoniella bestiolae CBS 10118]
MFPKLLFVLLPFLANVRAETTGVRIKSQLVKYGNLCLTVSSGKLAVGEEVHLSECVEDDNETSIFHRWSEPLMIRRQITIGGSDVFCLDIGDKWENGATLRLADCALGDVKEPPASHLWSHTIPYYQFWNFGEPDRSETVEDEQDDEDSLFGVDEKESVPKKCMSVKSDSQEEPGAPFSVVKRVQLWDCDEAHYVNELCNVT